MSSIFNRSASLSAVTSLLTVLAVACLSGCTQKDADAKADKPTFQEKITVDSVGTFDPIANSAAVPGGTYNTWGGPAPKSLNMWLDYNSFSANVMGLMFENLVSLHSVKDEPVGILAESWETSADGKTFTFRIDPRARWSDSTPITAGDF
jgi:microcin C transport system substrate-binding protein